MGVHSYEELLPHLGHRIEVVTYACGANVAVECMACNTILLDFDRPNGCEMEIPEMSTFLVEDEDLGFVKYKAYDIAGAELAALRNGLKVSCVMEGEEE